MQRVACVTIHITMSYNSNCIENLKLYKATLYFMDNNIYIKPLVDINHGSRKTIKVLDNNVYIGTLESQIPVVDTASYHNKTVDAYISEIREIPPYHYDAFSGCERGKLVTQHIIVVGN